ncbi:MAG: hypothetical protein UY00_C0050G0005 [Candidatus Wolfebacteria bacterium GW2011_GWA1_47_6]|nr:MAG: hypothetical protein UY00_C0050G0005 [Candidatus Wolfebacteria bacterium GW2011_GWA1_47_6]
MRLKLSVAVLIVVAEDDLLVVAILAQHGCLNLRVSDIRSSDGRIGAVLLLIGDEEHFVEDELLSDLDFQFLNLQFLSGGNLILLSPCFDDCEFHIS